MKCIRVNPLIGIAGVAVVAAAVLAATRAEEQRPGAAPPHAEPVAAVAQVHPAAERVLAGSVLPLGDGSIRSWVKVDADGYPKSVGVTFPEAALSNLPKGKGHISKVCCEGPAFELSLPADVAGLPFKHVWVNWNPDGHEPEGVYDKPHFDFHFCLQTAAERDAITAEGEDLTKCKNALTGDAIPAGYICPPGTIVPKMGAHWLPLTAPELQGKPFVNTLLYGSYDGRVNFIEPMITKAYLDSKPDFTEAVVTPKTVPTPGFYPTSYSVKFDQRTREYTVSLDNMVRRD